MHWLKLTVAYDGTLYAGWQVQPDAPSIQAEVETAWREITGEQVRVTASGRTDAGVHALGQVVGLATCSELSCNDLGRGLNAKLPEDISILEVAEAPDDFHATYDAQSKCYRYQIHNGRTRNVFERSLTWHYPQPLDATAMHEAAQRLEGRHDFSSFETSGSSRPDAVRTIFRIEVRRGQGGASERIDLEVEGDGFLYNMVRSIVGTLVQVGRGNCDALWVKEVLEARDRRRAGETAPPQGLFLVNVKY